MRVLLVGGSGTIGRRLAPELARRHEILVAGRNSGDARVDITSADSIENMYRQLPGVDAVVGIAASVPMDTLVGHYVDCIEGDATGRIIRAYG